MKVVQTIKETVALYTVVMFFFVVFYHVVCRIEPKTARGAVWMGLLVMLRQIVIVLKIQVTVWTVMVST